MGITLGSMITTMVSIAYDQSKEHERQLANHVALHCKTEGESLLCANECSAIEACGRARILMSVYESDELVARHTGKQVPPVHVEIP